MTGQIDDYVTGAVSPPFLVKKDKEIEELKNDLFQYKVTLQDWARDLKKMKKIIDQIPPDVLKQMEAVERAKRRNERER